jgi:hypothetical protein
MHHQGELDALNSLVDSLNASQDVLESAPSSIDSLAGLLVADLPADDLQQTGTGVRGTKALPGTGSLGDKERKAVTALLQSTSRGDATETPSSSQSPAKSLRDFLVQALQATRAQGPEAVSLLALYRACDSPKEQRDSLLDQLAAMMLADACAPLAVSLLMCIAALHVV